MKADKIPIPDSSAPWERVVTRMPLEQLFTEAGPTSHVRGESLPLAKVEAMLGSSREYRLVEACMDAPLRWWARGDYDFWYHRARHNAAEPNSHIPLDEFPGSRCYFISEWSLSGGIERALLFEEHH